MNQSGDHIKINFDDFQIKKKWMLQTLRAEKVDEKIGVICLVSMFAAWVMVCKLSKKELFSQFCADLSKIFEAIYIYVFESSHYCLSVNATIFKGLSHHSWDISD